MLVKTRMEKFIDLNATSEEAVRQTIKAYFEIMDDMQDEVLILYQELKALPKDAKDYVFEKKKKWYELLNVSLKIIIHISNKTN